MRCSIWAVLAFSILLTVSCAKSGHFETLISFFRKPFFILKDTENVQIAAIHFERSAGEGVQILGGRHSVISNCTFTNLGGQAVMIKAGFENGVQNCEFSDLGMGAIFLDSGNRKILTPGKSFVVNNHIHLYSQWIRTGQYAVKLSGVGNRVAHNLIHDAPHEGVYLSGNDHVTEYNGFTTCVRKLETPALSTRAAITPGEAT